MEKPLHNGTAESFQTFLTPCAFFAKFLHRTGGNYDMTPAMPVLNREIFPSQINFFLNLKGGSNTHLSIIPRNYKRCHLISQTKFILDLLLI